MAGDTILTITGNLVADPDLHRTPSGAVVVNFTVANTPRTFDRESGEWKDSESVYMRCSVWRDQAEHVATTLHQGDRVVVTGRLRTRKYTTSAGEARTVMEIEADEVAASLRYATAKLTRVKR